MYLAWVRKAGVIGRHGRDCLSFITSLDLKDILEPGHVFDEWIASIVDDMEADAGQVGFDGFVFELLLSKRADELAEDCL